MLQCIRKGGIGWQGIVTFLLTNLTTIVFAATTTTTSTTTTPPHIIPLVPHRVVQHRHRQRQLNSLWENSNDNITSTTTRTMTKVERPHHYPRWLTTTTRRTMEEDDIESFPPAQQVAGLFQGYGTHYADLWCGTPPQRQTVIVDTGSGITAFPCSNCHKCGVPDYHIDTLFDETASSTFTSLPCGQCLHGTCEKSAGPLSLCQMGQAYQEGSSWHAQEVMDTCYVGGWHDTPLTVAKDNNNNKNDILDPSRALSLSFPMKFGCQTSITGLFITQLADGIMGMDKAESSYWKQMVDAQKLDHAAFALCYSRSSIASRDGTPAGAMSLGGTDPRFHLSTMVYTDQSGPTSGFYQVYIRKAYLMEGGSSSSTGTNDDSALHTKVQRLTISDHDLNQGNVIVDSGTTDTYFHQNFGKAFYPLYQQMTGKSYDHKGHVFTMEELNAFPTILLQLSGDVVRNQVVAENNTTNNNNKKKKNHSPLPLVGTGLAGDLDPEHPYDVILAIPPTHYFEYDEDEGKYYARFYADERRGSVIGANAMMGHDVLFDIDNGILGWAESDCDYTTWIENFERSNESDQENHNNNDNNNNDQETPQQREQEQNSNHNNQKDNTTPSSSSQGGGNNDNNQDEEEQQRFQPEDPNDTVFEPRHEYCTSKTCQIGLTVVLVGAVIAVGYVLAHRTTVDEIEGTELTAAELEMQTPPSFYRDDDKDDDDDDEMPSSLRLT